jgi:uracil-DNA glycosylase family 4
VSTLSGSAKFAPSSDSSESGLIKRAHQLSWMSVLDSLEKITEEVRTCILCRLAESRLNAVPGEGPGHAKLFFIGEGPGSEEDRQGRPFVGRAGELLNESLETARLNREEVFITNVVKCRPPSNRTPLMDEAEACEPYLERQVALVEPKIICLLGNTAIERLLGEAKPGIRGKMINVKGRNFFPTVHPAAAIYNPRLRKVLEIHLARLKAELERPEGQSVSIHNG